MYKLIHDTLSAIRKIQTLGCWIFLVSRDSKPCKRITPAYLIKVRSWIHINAKRSLMEAEPVFHLHSWCISADPTGNIYAKADSGTHKWGWLHLCNGITLILVVVIAQPKRTQGWISKLSFMPLGPHFKPPLNTRTTWLLATFKNKLITWYRIEKITTIC